MANEPLSDSELSLMCDILQSSSLEFIHTKERELDRLLRDGLIAVDETAAAKPVRYKITDDGQRLLDDLGVGNTES
ncbi:hypothetical protein BH10PSE7_BH10PSE7_41530 [soil metagenome]